MDLYGLGILYMYGRDVRTNLSQPGTCFSIAARAGHPTGERMARTIRDVHAPSVDPESNVRRPESSCYAQAGVPAGPACFRGGDVIMYQ